MKPRPTPAEELELLQALIAEIKIEGRWRGLMADMNGDGRVTISDVGLWLKWFFFAPGDAALSIVILGTPDFARFLEIDTGFFYGWLSGIVSVVVWPIVFGFILSIRAEHMQEWATIVGVRVLAALGCGCSARSFLPRPGFGS